jgi:hypothetical protein
MTSVTTGEAESGASDRVPVTTMTSPSVAAAAGASLDGVGAPALLDALASADALALASPDAGEAGGAGAREPSTGAGVAGGTSALAGAATAIARIAVARKEPVFPLESRTGGGKQPYARLGLGHCGRRANIIR